MAAQIDALQGELDEANVTLSRVATPIAMVGSRPGSIIKGQSRPGSWQAAAEASKAEAEQWKAAAEHWRAVANGEEPGSSTTSHRGSRPGTGITGISSRRSSKLIDGEGAPDENMSTVPEEEEEPAVVAGMTEQDKQDVEDMISRAVNQVMLTMKQLVAPTESRMDRAERVIKKLHVLNMWYVSPLYPPSVADTMIHC